MRKLLLKLCRSSLTSRGIVGRLRTSLSPSAVGNASHSIRTAVDGTSTPSNGVPFGLHRDQNDFQQLEHFRSVLGVEHLEHYGPRGPLLFNAAGGVADLQGIYREAVAFLVCGGPSLHHHDLTQLERRGVLTMSVNNVATIVRPRLWCCVDDPGNFADAIWRDPGMVKFAPLGHLLSRIVVRDREGALIESSERVADMPAVFGYLRNESFQPQQWLNEDTFNWGNHATVSDEHGNSGSRSVMYVALRILHYLGVRQVYLLGCDFRMSADQTNYAFEQDRSPAAIRKNNRSYAVLNQRLLSLLPYFERTGFHVQNCTRDSALTVFPYISFEDAMARAVAAIPHSIVTSGMYDRLARIRAMSRSERPGS